MSLVIDFEGFQFSSSYFIVKELAFYAGPHFSGAVTFQPPFPVDNLSVQQKRTCAWVTRNLHHIDWHEGQLPYFYFKTVLCFLFQLFPRIYVKGLQKKKFLEFLSGRECFDLEELNCPKNVSAHVMCLVHISNFQHCALAKVTTYGTFLNNL